MKRKTLTLLCAGLMAVTNLNVCMAQDDTTSTAADVLVERPLSFVATLVGSVLFVVSLPFAAASGSVHQAADTLVVKPAEFTFQRPIGDF